MSIFFILNLILFLFLLNYCNNKYILILTIISLILLLLIIFLTIYFLSLINKNSLDLIDYIDAISSYNFNYEPKEKKRLTAFNIIYNELEKISRNFLEKEKNLNSKQLKYNNILKYNNEIIFEYNFETEIFITNSILFNDVFGFYPHNNRTVVDQFNEYLDIKEKEKFSIYCDNIYKDLLNKKTINESIILKINLNNKIKYISIFSSLSNMNTNKIILGIVKDVTKDFEEKYKLEKKANFDLLTGLYNKSKFKEILKKKIHNSKSFNLLFIDIDNFKTINDNYGHLIGDKVISFIGYNIRRLTSKSIIASRYGGDEFVICTNTNNQANYFIKSFSKRLKEGYYLNINEKIEIKTSIGIVNYPNNAKSIDKLIDLADKAMYKSKKEKKIINE